MFYIQEKSRVTRYEQQGAAGQGGSIQGRLDTGVGLPATIDETQCARIALERSFRHGLGLVEIMLFYVIEHFRRELFGPFAGGQ